MEPDRESPKLKLAKYTQIARQTLQRIQPHMRYTAYESGHVFHIAILIGITALFMIPWMMYQQLIMAPSMFPTDRVITIAEGATISDVAEQFEALGIVQSSVLTRLAVRFVGGDVGVIAGDYFFRQPENFFAVVETITEGDFGLLPENVTIPEGVTTFEMAEIFAQKFSQFDKEAFIALAQPKEGYLFPDTYLFLPNVKEESVVQTMEENFYKKIDEIQEEIDASGKTLEEIVIMASMLEKEASRHETRRKIAGVLWHRLDIGMLLQVDATFLYINGRNTYELTRDDLKDESPYNTYRHKGLPIGPIASPSLSSLLAAVTPIESDYLFYLADRQGNTYFSRTFDQHIEYKLIYVD